MANQSFPLPDVGEGLTEAEIVEWRVKPGDPVQVNQTIVEIETAKSLVELPSPWSGTVVGLLAEPGTTVEVGTPIIEIAVGGVVSDDGPGPGAPADASAAGGASATGDTTVPAAPAEPESAGEAASADSETSGSVLVGYGTQEAKASGRRRRYQGGPAASASAAPTAPAVAPAPQAPPRASPAPAPVVPATPPAPAPVTPAPATGVASVPTSDTRTRVLAKPPVRKLAKDLGIDLAGVHPSGPGGIVTREDVLAHQAAAQPRTLATYAGDTEPWLESGAVSGDGRETRVPVKSVRKRTAEAMVASAFTAPHVTVFHTVDVTRTMELVETLKKDRDFSDVKVTPLLIAAKAVLLAIRRHPQINASWDEAAQEIVYKHYANLGIAAATPRGLVVPNIKDAHRLDLLGLANAIADLTGTAREGRTPPSDMTGGTFTITNVGVFGIDSGTPILNPGEAGILAFGAIRQQPWVHDGELAVRWVTQLALSIDHRLVDGELGARFLADVAAVLQDPSRGLVWGR
ncbi:dihydrolipoamide acetyltransferase family protein [Myceligenerans pegani]|uniref:Dihydrolipoamide acetyltransferase component of pyruvate dehydrogenase complex n=1 Tax=Myceligenerans pegani TaxID=2776917 RepID=A0ABR9MRZ1_9MICO|nr:dihydrolipoamide acetyltransferase family protein [Myceligenerans sp. TRM 65318]MBE1874152.1 2-oxo acid dehydrogenase subunit E2 [Myceligenerans sp. TRM 65318]MBE3016424.1 2-oxo acid dehydrogenase subunit E2 [Myceligenerans sp. TRM 65318]